jgi:two-component system sensor histidine kinase HupT/HoxJ
LAGSGQPGAREGSPNGVDRGEPLEVLLARARWPVDELRSKLHGGPEITKSRSSTYRDADPAVDELLVALRSEGHFIGLNLIGRPVASCAAPMPNSPPPTRPASAQKQLVFSKDGRAQRLVCVAHELNNPISFVFGNMHALKRYGGRLTKYLQAIDRGESSDRLLELRNSLKIDRILLDVGPLVEGTLEGAERVSEIVQDLRRFSSSQTVAAGELHVIRVVRTAISWVVKTTRIKPEVVPICLIGSGWSAGAGRFIRSWSISCRTPSTSWPAEQKLIVSGARRAMGMVRAAGAYRLR